MKRYSRNPSWGPKTKPVGEGGAKSQPYESGRGPTVERPPEISIGEILRSVRKAKKMSQKALGELLGKDHSQVSRAESDTDHFPRLTHLVAHLNALGMQLAIMKPNGDIVVLPNSDFLDRYGRPKSDGATERKKDRRSRG